MKMHHLHPGAGLRPDAGIAAMRREIVAART